MKADYLSNPENKRTVRILAFVISVVSTSTAVSFAAFIDNGYLLAAALIPCVITLSITITPVPVSAKNILLCGILSCCVSVLIIVYALITHWNTLKVYLGFE